MDVKRGGRGGGEGGGPVKLSGEEGCRRPHRQLGYHKTC